MIPNAQRIMKKLIEEAQEGDILIFDHQRGIFMNQTKEKRQMKNYKITKMSEKDKRIIFSPTYITRITKEDLQGISNE